MFFFQGVDIEIRVHMQFIARTKDSRVILHLPVLFCKKKDDSKEYSCIYVQEEFTSKVIMCYFRCTLVVYHKISSHA